jgi:hypothetical protein
MLYRILFGTLLRPWKRWPRWAFYANGFELAVRGLNVLV